MIAWLVQTLIASLLLMALVLLMRAPVSRMFGAHAAYALWLLPALRMILPPLPGWQAWFVPIACFTRGHTTVGLVDPASAAQFAPAAIDPGPVTPVPLLQPAPDALAGIDMATLLIALWLGVAILWFGWQMLRYRRFLAFALDGAAPLTTECGVEVLMSPNVAGPVAVGILRRRILLPVDFLARYSAEERQLALLHEAAHHDRFDILANLAALAVHALHWWNPVAHRAYRAFRADQELACDATVLDQADAARRATYGRALLKSAVAQAPTMACAFNPKSQLKQRIRMMTRRPIGRVRLLCGAMLAVATIGGGMAATASGFAAEPVEMAELPAPPAPPAPPEQPAAPRAPASPVVRAAAVPAPPAAPAAPIAPTAPAAPVPPAAPQPPAARATLTDRDLAPAEQHRIDRTVERARDAADRAQRRAEAALRTANAAQSRAAAARVRAREIDVPRLVDASLADARRRLAAQCARTGESVPADSDWGRLATCGARIHAQVASAMAGARIGMAQARAAIARDRRLSSEQRAEAMEEIDDALSQLDDELSDL